MSDPVLAARGVTVVKKGQRILDGASLDVAPGERLLVQGRSGAGKTTLFNVLALLERPTAGRVLVQGQETGSLAEADRARIRRETVGVVFQDFQLVPDLTARENARLPQEHTGLTDEDWLDRLFETIEMEDIADQYPATLSGGEKQRVAIARALANRPVVLLADEPTGQLDPATTDAVLSLLLDVQAETETALVTVSHDPQLTDQFERTVALRDGRAVTDDDSTE